ncbi:MAG TPA: Crp/Fnr family transcriptional regulator [Ktedonobacterales bacterium]|jgi:CRP/FNR family transcriptional regulator
MPLEISALRTIQWFNALSDAELAPLQKKLRERRMQRGEILFFEGEPGEWMYSIQSGLIKVFKTSADGREQVLRLFHAGDSFNEVPMFDGGPNPASAMAMEDSVVYGLSRQDIQTLLKENPVFARSVIQVLASRLRNLVGLVEDLSFRHVKSRVARALLMHSSELAPGIPHRLTQQELAAIVGTAREVVGRALKALEQEGVLHLDQGRITILDQQLLEQASLR